jgi:hypothetical protein
MNLFKKYGSNISYKDILKADGVFGCYKMIILKIVKYD